MPKGIPNKRYTGEFKQMVVETMEQDVLDYCRECFALSKVMQFIGVGVIFNLNKKTLATMNDELNARRAASK